jgi:DNA-binding NarL/FixJ family response regulator
MARELPVDGANRVPSATDDVVGGKAACSSMPDDFSNAAERPLDLLIVSDIRFLREGLAEVLTRESAFRTIHVAADLTHALAAMRAASPDMVLIDAALPDGLSAARRLRSLAPQVQIIALAVAETDAEVISWAEAGISGYVPRSVALGDLTDVLTGIRRGEQACSTHVAAGLLRRIANAPHATATSPRPSYALTAREEEVVGLIGAGLTNKEIARHLKIGLATTKSHVHNVLGKLELAGRNQVSRWVHDHGRTLDQSR